MPGAGLDDEIKRMGDTYWNYIEPIKVGRITAVGTNTADVYISGTNYTEKAVPVLNPNYNVTINNPPSGMTVEFTIALSVGDNVIVAFINGQAGNPVIIGKL